MLTEIEEDTIARRRLILRDSLAILSLVAGTGVLFAVTLFLFHSFSSHRADLAVRWSERGRSALQAGQPEQAIVALRTALSYAPGERDYELLLAQALGAAGHTEESYEYFMGLWETQPGNGEVNLQLARLAARRNKPADAVNFYRASIYGTWEGDGVMRRLAVRLELARYLIANHNLAAARSELLIAGGNGPDDYDRDMTIGSLLEAAQDFADAWTYFQRASALRPNDPAAHEAAGRLAYESGDYESAHRLLARAQAERMEAHDPAGQTDNDRTMTEDAARIVELMPSPAQPVRVRADRILATRGIAKKRFDSCSARFAAESPLPTELQALDARWTGPEGTANPVTLQRDSALQESTMQLVFDTEVQAQRLCDPASGDDALLLRLATHPETPLSPAGKITQAIDPHD